MSRSRFALLSAVVLYTVGSTVSAQSAVADFASDPTLAGSNQPLFEARPASSPAFVWDADTPSRFPGDPKGSLSVVYDSLASTSRFFTSLGGLVTENDDFVFGVVMTIRPDGFAPDPFGFHPITVSLWNAAATGDDRTGDLSDFRADTFDTVEMAWFPNVSPFFGGPYLSPTMFGERIADDAFANFAFGSGVVPLQPGVTYLVLVEHSATAKTLTIDLFVVKTDGRAVALPAWRMVTDLSRVSGFAVDSLGIPAYFDGFNIFSSSGRSLYAVVDYDLLFAGVKIDGALPKAVEKALKRLSRTSRLISTDPGEP